MTNLQYFSDSSDPFSLAPDVKQAGYGSKAQAFVKGDMLYIEFFETPSVMVRSNIEAHGFVPQKSISPLVWANTYSHPALFYAGHISW